MGGGKEESAKQRQSIWRASEEKQWKQPEVQKMYPGEERFENSTVFRAENFWESNFKTLNV